MPRCIIIALVHSEWSKENNFLCFHSQDNGFHFVPEVSSRDRPPVLVLAMDHCNSKCHSVNRPEIARPLAHQLGMGGRSISVEGVLGIGTSFRPTRKHL
ncbi:hypothetical protein CEXT_28591 [Caerostris extrusa]|uniref:Uncharacterized protein n=1 Tax=Caerostris extrusa TaxID=172846 RepID=A0AAV4TY44_CAEEX|nr:hypothetical protein CEXT_28591 [Caerostris extrusa]